MKTHTHYLWFETKKRQEIIDITDELEAQLRESGIREGFALLSAMHISASVFVNDHSQACGTTSCTGSSTVSLPGNHTATVTTRPARTTPPRTCEA